MVDRSSRFRLEEHDAWRRQRPEAEPAEPAPDTASEEDDPFTRADPTPPPTRRLRILQAALVVVALILFSFGGSGSDEPDLPLPYRHVVGGGVTRMFATGERAEVIVSVHWSGGGAHRNSAHATDDGRILISIGEDFQGTTAIRVGLTASDPSAVDIRHPDGRELWIAGKSQQVDEELWPATFYSTSGSALIVTSRAAQELTVFANVLAVEQPLGAREPASGGTPAVGSAAALVGVGLLEFIIRKRTREATGAEG